MITTTTARSRSTSALLSCSSATAATSRKTRFISCSKACRALCACGCCGLCHWSPPATSAPGNGLQPIVQAQPACVAGNVDNGSYVTYKMFLDYMVERFMSTYVFRR